jgi:hypothetical protein
MTTDESEPEQSRSDAERAGKLEPHDEDDATSRETGELRRLADELRASWRSLSAPLHRSRRRRNL